MKNTKPKKTHSLQLAATMQKNNQQIKTLSFTLIEVLIALSLIALIGGSIGWHVNRLISHHRFQSEATSLCQALQEAQFLSVIGQTECELHIYREEKGLFYRLKTDEPSSLLDQNPKALKGAKSLTLNNVRVPHVHFKILSSGRIEPVAILGLHHREENPLDSQSIWLDLQTPIQIKLLNEKPRKFHLPIPSMPKESGSHLGEIQVKTTSKG